jgi:hypothetical protein
MASRWGDDEPDRSASAGQYPGYPAAGPRVAPGWGTSAPFSPVLPASKRTTVVLVLGIAAVLLSLAGVIGLLPAIVALALAPGARRDLARPAADPAAPRRRGGRAELLAGILLAWVAVLVVAAKLLLALAGAD